ncbi:lysylphosphatidylglycerol synthase domain-containing protein [Vandammella animalimorsus]|uniref:lysylphosphatidylglycerol synthase domain-containing protein n=1 Tax=Vandammella animalimorsus TaxID=2029117 RepID=UPI00325C2CBC
MQKNLSKNNWIAAAKILITTAALLFVLRTLTENFSEIKKFIGPESYIAIAFCAPIFLLTILSGSLAWSSLLRSDRLTRRQLTTVYLVTQIGKYLPGNIAQHVGRVILLKKNGIEPKVIMASIIMETMLATSIASALGMAGIISFFSQDFLKYTPALIGILFLPFFLHPIIRLIDKRFNTSFLQYLSLNSREHLVAASLFFLANFMLMGAAGYIQLIWIFDAHHARYLPVVFAFALIWVIGYVTPGAPGGIGVRESATILLISPMAGTSAATGVALTLRLTTIIADLMAFALGYFLNTWKGYGHEN